MVSLHKIIASWFDYRRYTSRSGKIGYIKDVYRVKRAVNLIKSSLAPDTDEMKITSS